MKKSVFLITILLSTAFSTVHAQLQIREGTITNLYDAFGKNDSLTQDFGFSCILKYGGKTILFDAGSNTDIFKNNAEKLGIDLRQVDIAIVSHAHFDHLDGMDYLLDVNPKVKIYMPYDIFWGAPVPFDATGQEPAVKDSLPAYMQYFNGGETKFSIRQSGRFWKADVENVKESREILPGARLVATSSPFMGYFSGYPGKSFAQGQFEQQDKTNYRYTNLPEISLSLTTDDGEVMIVGCSHSGVENIVRAAKDFTQNRMELVYGGFHLLPFDREQLQQLGGVLKNELGVERVAPAHCTGHLAFRILKTLYGKDYLFAGLGETVSFEKK
jgi:7,8-dihydropterin-6-yl-methyl-4-(beta-D-ribofuranosyl)aminobenzene 5'-phosphate synthase